MANDDAREREAGYRRETAGGDPNAHRHGDVAHSHPHTGPHEHGDDLEYDEAHDPEEPGEPGKPEGRR